MKNPLFIKKTRIFWRKIPSPVGKLSMYPSQPCALALASSATPCNLGVSLQWATSWRTVLPPPHHTASLCDHFTRAPSLTQLRCSVTTGSWMSPPPPKTDPLEQSLPQPYRTNLPQLRSGYCFSLENYICRIGLSDSAAHAIQSRTLSRAQRTRLPLPSVIFGRDQLRSPTSLLLSRHLLLSPLPMSPRILPLELVGHKKQRQQKRSLHRLVVRGPEGAPVECSAISL